MSRTNVNGPGRADSRRMGSQCLELETAGGGPGLMGRLRCGVRNTGYSEEISKEGEGRSRLSSYCSSEISAVQGSSIHLYI